MAGYSDLASVVNRANSVLCRIELLVNDRSIPSTVRLVRIAEIMAEEPVLTDNSPAAHSVRRLAREMDR